MYRYQLFPNVIKLCYFKGLATRIASSSLSPNKPCFPKVPQATLLKNTPKRSLRFKKLDAFLWPDPKTKGLIQASGMLSKPTIELLNITSSDYIIKSLKI